MIEFKFTRNFDFKLDSISTQNFRAGQTVLVPFRIARAAMVAEAGHPTDPDVTLPPEDEAAAPEDSGDDGEKPDPNAQGALGDTPPAEVPAAPAGRKKRSAAPADAPVE